MLQSLFRAAAADFDVSAFVDRYDIQPDDVWLRGDPGPRGQHAESGFSLLLAEAEEFSEHLEELEASLLDFEEAIRELRSLAIPCRICCGLTVGGKTHFTRSFILSPQLMLKLGELSVEFIVSAYPCAE